MLSNPRGHPCVCTPQVLAPAFPAPCCSAPAESQRSTPCRNMLKCNARSFQHQPMVSQCISSYRLMLHTCWKHADCSQSHTSHHNSSSCASTGSCMHTTTRTLLLQPIQTSNYHHVSSVQLPMFQGPADGGNGTALGSPWQAGFATACTTLHVSLPNLTPSLLWQTPA
jgi:hypothetical protein